MGCQAWAAICMPDELTRSWRCDWDVGQVLLLLLLLLLLRVGTVA
jgi:hypothetical protein